jgi:iron(III) transport system substrate-binding protein
MPQRKDNSDGRARVRVGLGLAAAAVLALLAGCGNSGSRGATGSTARGTTITLYNSQHEQTTAALVAAFTKQTGIKVRVRNGDEDVLTAQLIQEGNRSPADVFFTENSNWLQQLADRGLLAKVDASTLAAVPRRDSGPQGNWLGISARVSALVYNTDKLSASELPTSVMGLADPKWKGKLELAPAETDLWPIISSVARAHGDAAALAWLNGLKANAAGAGSVPDNETLVSDISKGTAQLGLINHYYYYRLLAELGKNAVHAKLAYFAPGDPGYVEDISGAGIIKSSQRQAAAQKFLAFLASAAGQTALAHTDSFEYPIRPGVAANPALPPLTSFHPSSFTVTQLGTGLDAEQLLREAGLI